MSSRPLEGLRVLDVSALAPGPFATMGRWGPRGTNLVDGSAPFYGTYRCADGRYVAVGAIEDPFWLALLEGLGLGDDGAFAHRMDPARWPEQRRRLAALFIERPRDHWVKLLADTDACVTPVLELDELTGDEHLTARGSFSRGPGATEAAPAPRLSRTPGRPGEPAPAKGSETDAVLIGAGFTPEELAALRQSGALG